MASILDLFAILAIILPASVILMSLLNLQATKRAKEEQFIEHRPDESLLSDPSKEILVSVFSAKKAVRETIRIIFDGYRDGLSELRNLPEEAEYLAQLLLFAIRNLQSSNASDVMSGLQTLSALGTRNLLMVLQEDISNLERRWEYNVRITRMAQMAKQRILERFEGEHKISLIIDASSLDKRTHASEDKISQENLIVLEY